jgi:hypothetical protein
MKDLFESDDDMTINAGNGVVVHYMCSRLLLRITASKAKYSYSRKPENPFNILSKSNVIEQGIFGNSEVVDNSSLNERVYARQPNTNKIFEGESIYVCLREKKPTIEMLDPFSIHNRYWKGKLSTTFMWDIEDRSFFTRLVLLLNTRGFIDIEVTTDINDEEFSKYCMDGASELPNVIKVKSVLLS